MLFMHPIKKVLQNTGSGSNSSKHTCGIPEKNYVNIDLWLIISIHSFSQSTNMHEGPSMGHARVVLGLGEIMVTRTWVLPHSG